MEKRGIKKLKYKRKLLVLVICIATGFCAAFIMGEAHYKIFVEGIVWLSGGFFMGNAAEHVSNTFKRGSG